jgi:hypothetical protein
MAGMSKQPGSRAAIAAAHESLIPGHERQPKNAKTPPASKIIEPRFF